MKGNCFTTTCPKSGIKIHDSNNNYINDPFQQQKQPIIQKNMVLDQLDLNIDNYSMDDLFILFSIKNKTLNDEIMKESKKIVLKIHPDKSHLDTKYFLFFSKAYKRLFGIYEFQNKSLKKEFKENDYYKTENTNLLDNVFQQNKDLKDPKNFNTWFNEKFDKHKVDEEENTGYGEWLKTDEGIYDVGSVSKSDMNQEFEKQKKQIQGLTVYNGFNEQYASTFGGSILGQQDNYSSGNLFSSNGNNFTDLRQAYIETVIPVTEEDYQNMPKFQNIEQYKNHRNNIDVKPLTKDVALNQLYEQNKNTEQESIALAYYYAKQTEKSL